MCNQWQPKINQNEVESLTLSYQDVKDSVQFPKLPPQPASKQAFDPQPSSHWLFFVLEDVPHLNFPISSKQI